MQIANYKLYTINSGEYKLDGGAMFGVIPKTLWQKFAPADEFNRIRLALRTLLLDDGKRKILIDTGIGHKFTPKECDIYGIDHSSYTIDLELKKLGLTRLDITDIFITHLHFDHIGGATHYEDNKLTPSFKNATYHIDRFHYEWAMKPTRRDRASFLKENFSPLEEAGQIKLIEKDTHSLFPNTEIIRVHGHTPYQCLLKIKDQKTTMLYCADLIPMAAHIPLPWIMGYDLNALTTLSEKEIILDQAYNENWLLFFEHDPEYELATIIKTEKDDFKASQTYKTMLDYTNN